MSSMPDTASRDAGPPASETPDCVGSVGQPLRESKVG
jgi:hypothetical protein